MMALFLISLMWWVLHQFVNRCYFFYKSFRMFSLTTNQHLYRQLPVVVWNKKWVDVNSFPLVAHKSKHQCWVHYGDVIMSMIASQITSLTIVYSTVYSDVDQSKHQSSASLAFVRGIHRGPVNSPHKWPVTRKMFPFDDVIMYCQLVTYEQT